MPADRRADRVALDEDLDEVIGLDAGQLCCTRTRGLEPVGNRLSRLRLARLVVVVETEVTRSAARGLAVDHDRVEAERLDVREERRFLFGSEEVGPVDEAFGLFGRRSRHVGCVPGYSGAKSSDAMDPGGLEPPTFWLPARRSPS